LAWVRNGTIEFYDHFMSVGNKGHQMELSQRLARALTACGYRVTPDDTRLAPLVERFSRLLDTGRYARLVTDVLAANDESNLKSLLVEGAFAFQFEQAGIPLQYEVRKRPDGETSLWTF
jgi:hypothetical protein